MRKFATFAAMTALLVFAGAGFLQAKTFVIPHIVESSGKITNTTYTFDTVINLVYVGGQPGAGTTSSVDVDLYLFNNNTGDFLTADGTPTGTHVCDPCSAHLTAGSRKQQFRIDDLVTAKLNGWTGGRNGYGILVVDGDSQNLTLQGFVSNAHTSAFDMSVFGFVPTEIQAAAN